MFEKKSEKYLLYLPATARMDQMRSQPLFTIALAIAQIAKFSF